ncbi:D-tyrosyl-tRNA(Tyr) deacylase [Gammaproteobacteria bacterium LSUCC0057]|uniref:D-aminoacyl-tRNA deacylase n=1 Tax=Gammaproteobacteria bacterium LSUCC0057 TaxID=2559237 RepID=A0A4Y8UK98_9GAMM|nr:D-tyrosyl-tRNA(Tyr) deacylase [Gammaproteobacteria bacterium LSUCC0057]
MQALIQRVSHASVAINGVTTATIGRGLLLLLGLEKTDTAAVAAKTLQRVIDYRVFSDSDGKMNCSLRDIGGELLIVSQFTLAADTAKGRRPSFASAMAPAPAEQLYRHFLALAAECGVPAASGEFGADMQVSLCNDGPVTFLL